MITSSQVNSDSSALEGYFNEYNEYINGLSDSWKGDSHDSITQQTTSFTAEYSAINEQMSNFANACSLYERYKNIKEEIARKEQALSFTNNDDYKEDINRRIASLHTTLNQVKNNINSYLDSARTPKLTASSVTKTT